MNLLKGMIPPSRNGRVLAIGGTVDSIGTGLFIAASTLYFVQIVGLPAVAVGAALAVGGVCGLLSPVPLGMLADRVGAGKVFVALLCVRAVGYASYGLVGDYLPYILLTCVLMAADAASAPLFQSIVGEVVPAAERSATMTSIRAIRNVGLSVGFLLAAGAQALHWTPAFFILFILNGLSFLGTGLAIRNMRTTLSTPPAVKTEAALKGVTISRPPHRNGRFIGLVVANTLAMLHDSLLLVLFPLWVVGVLNMPASFASILLAINTLQTALSQGYIGRFVQGLASSVRTIRLACGLLVVTCLLLGVASSIDGTAAVVVAITAVIVLTLAENLLVAANWEVSYIVSPEDRRSQYLAFFSLGSGSQRAIGPLLMTAVVLPAGSVGWGLLGVLFALAAGGTTLATREARSV